MNLAVDKVSVCGPAIGERYAGEGDTCQFKGTGPTMQKQQCVARKRNDRKKSDVHNRIVVKTQRPRWRPMDTEIVVSIRGIKHTAVGGHGLAK